MLANGKWFTVNNTFLRITHSTGYTTDYLYAVTSDGTFYHDSYQAYERADFRMFQKKANSAYLPSLLRQPLQQRDPKGCRCFALCQHGQRQIDVCTGTVPNGRLQVDNSTQRE